MVPFMECIMVFIFSLWLLWDSLVLDFFSFGYLGFPDHCSFLHHFFAKRKIDFGALILIFGQLKIIEREKLKIFWRFLEDFLKTSWRLEGDNKMPAPNKHKQKASREWQKKHGQVQPKMTKKQKEKENLKKLDSNWDR